ncbi:xylulokinase [bacterium]|nr:xylulokinase [bacterium]
MRYLVGLDVGTTGAKAALYDETGRRVAASTSEYPLVTPRPGWSEQDPQAWWEGTLAALEAVVAEAGVSPQAIAGLGLSGQMHGSVFLDAEGAPVRPAILWNDSRTARQCDEIAQRLGLEILTSVTCNPPLTGFTAPKVLWLREHEPQNYRRVAHLVLPKDYIRFKLTGTLAADPSDAAGTLLFDVPHGEWSREVLQRLEIPVSWMPPVVASGAPAGELRPEVAKRLGLPAHIPVAAGGADNACAAVGSGAVREGQGIVSLGTSGTIVAPMASPVMDPKQRVHTFNHAVDRLWYLMGVVLSAGLCLRWVRDELARDVVAKAREQGRDAYDLLTELAAEAPPGCEGLVFLPYLMGERSPHKNPDARGMFFGLTYRHRRAHLIRAVLEGVSFALRDSVEIIRGLGVRFKHLRATGGGGRSLFWRQMLADVFNVPIARLNQEEGACLGAALMGGVAAGVYVSLPAAAESVINVVEVTDPNEPELYEEPYRLFRALYPATVGLLPGATVGTGLSLSSTG